MSPSPDQNSQSPDETAEDYFNDLSQQPPKDGEKTNGGVRRSSQDNSDIPKPKRIACILCRKRKLRCDGIKPSCGTCTRLQHECSYDEVRRKSGPKRGYVKALEARLAQVETLLTKKDEPPKTKTASNASARPSQPSQNSGLDQPYNAMPALGSSNLDMLSHMEHTINQFDPPPQATFPHTALNAAANGDIQTQEEAFPWEMIGLGLDEPLPTQDVVNELNQIYFEKIHPSLPMIHRPRYFAAMSLAPHMRPPVCLRYAMWANAAAVSEKYEALQEHFYQRARKYIQQDEMKGHGESMITVAHSQTWCLVATYEFKLMYFPRAWMSAGRACRLAQMMGMHRLDGQGLDVKQCLPPPKDLTDREERRRTFWVCFCVDRYSSIGTGWPMTIEEDDIMTCLPCDEDSYEMCLPTEFMTLTQALLPDGAPKLSGYAGVVVMATLFGRNLTHLHRPSPDDKDDDLNGEFWRRHRSMDNILLNTALALPENCRLPAGLNDPNVVFMNMNIHTSTICLHQAAIFKADKNKMPGRISAESKIRCITAAAEIASIMRTISHCDLSTMNPFISFCLYVAARVFVQYLKSRPNDSQIKSSLQFVLTAMHAIKRKNPLTESFLVQLDVDLEGAGLEDSRSMQAQAKQNSVPQASQYYETAAKKFPRTYGDGGLSAYTAPEMMNTGAGTDNITQFEAPLDQSTFGSMMNANIGLAQVEIPHRQRTPGSFHASSSHNDSAQMDMSPDAGGGNGNFSPQNGASSHTSNTSYSPQNQQDQMFGNNNNNSNGSKIQTPGRLSGPSLFDPNDASFSTDFQMHSFPATTHGDAQQQGGFVFNPQQQQQQSWPMDESGSTGLTPAPGGTGFTPAASGMTPGVMNDMMNMSEQEWNQMLDSMNAQQQHSAVAADAATWVQGSGMSQSAKW